MANEASIGWVRLAPILAVQFIGTLGYSIALPFLVFLVTDFGGAAWTYGLVGATYSAFQFFGAPLLGRWSDRVGRRPVLVISQAGTMVAWLLFLAAFALPRRTLFTIADASLTLPLLVIFAARALDGATGGNISVANAYVADLTRDAKSMRRIAFGRMGMAASLGFAIGPAVAGVLGATPWGYVAPVTAAAVISALATVLCLGLRDPGGKCPEGPPGQPALTRVLGQEQRRCDRPPPEATPGALRRPIVIAVLAATFVQFLAFNLFYAGFPVHVRGALHWDAGRLGLFYAVLSAALIAAQGPLLRLASAHLKARALFVLGMLGLIASFVAFTFPQTWVIFLGAILFAVGNGLAWPTFQARVAEIAGEDNQGAVQGAASSAGSLASILGLVVGGMLYPLMGVWVLVAGAAVFALVAAGTPVWFHDFGAGEAADPGES